MKADKNLKENIISGLFWRFGERICAQLITFIVSIVIARILSPKDYGAIAMVMTFITLANVFVSSGFGNALIQKKNADNIDFSTVLYFNLALSCTLYAILFMSAPYIARFYNMPVLCNVLRVLSIKLPLASINSVQQAYVSRLMIFKRFFFSTIFGTIGSAIIGISMALYGFGIWALVWQYLFNSVSDTIILWYTVKWRPVLKFSLKRLRPLFCYGFNILASNLLYNLCNELSNLIIGKKYTSFDLAYYTKGKQFPNLIVININTTISSVLFPALSKEQNNKEKVLKMTRMAIRVSSYLMSPILLGMFAVSNSLVRLLLTDKWLFCVPYLQLYCLFYLLQPMQTANLEAIKAIGRSDLYFKMEVKKRIIQILILLISMHYGVLAIAIGNVLSSWIRSFINAYPNRRLLGYSLKMQIFDMFPSIIISLFMSISVLIISNIKLDTMVLIIVQVVIGIIIYLVLSIIFKIDSYYYILDIIKKYKEKVI